MVELELLGVKWAMNKCRQYLLGLPHFTLVVDHQPLVSILDKQTLDCIDNARLQRLKASLSPYNFTTVWKKGREHRIPDALSRSPVQDPTEEDVKEDEDIHGYICTAAVAIERHEDDVDEETVKQADPILEDLRKAGQQDEEYKALLEAILHDKKPPALYTNIIDRLSTDKGLVLLDQRIVVPRNKRKEVLKKLHASHQGIEKTKRRARQSVFWPGISSDVASTVAACPQCQLRLPSQQHEPMERDPPPEQIFQEVAGDFFEVDGRHHLIITDRYSGYPVVYHYKSAPTAAATINSLREMFSSFGCPIRFLSDGGLQFVAQETQEFFVRWGIRHRLSTATYAQSNGLAESAVKTVKHLLQKCGGTPNEAFQEGLMELRNCPRVGGKSPAEIVFGHPLRSRLPCHTRAFSKEWQVSMEDHDKKTAEATEKATARYDATSKSRTPIPVGSQVRIQHHSTHLWDRVGKVLFQGKSRDYQVKLPSGRVIWRNRRFLRPIPEEPPMEVDTKLSEEQAKVPEAKMKKEASKTDQMPRRSKRVRFKPDRYKP